MGIMALAGAGSAFSNINSLAFDGSNDFLSGSSTFTSLNGASKASFSMWIKPVTVTGTLRTVFQVGDGSSSGVNGQCQMFLYEGVRIDFSIDSSGLYGRGNISALTYGSWNHVLLTVDFAANPEFKCYVNGADETTGDNMASLSVFPNATEPLHIGEFATGHYAPFNGGIDEFAIWVGDALTSTDASNIYNSGAPTDLTSNSGDYTSSSNLIGYWKFDETSGTTIADSSTNSNDLTLVNSPTFDPGDAPS